ncbi:MAG: DUF72 domain-containing protein [Planctomycetota bacterium]
MARLYVGTSGWSYRDWKDIVYPTSKAKAALPYMAEYFDAVEVNTSFYGSPNPRYCEKWLDEVKHNPNFMFTLKLWQRFTHERDAPWTEEEAGTFRDGVAPIAEAGKLGALLIQFPWAFENTEPNRKWLLRLAESFHTFPLVVEARHKSWETAPAMRFFKEHRLGFCNIDQPATRDSIGPTSIATGDLAYYRFHGRNEKNWFAKDTSRDARYDYLYSEDELQPWVRDIAEMDKRVEQIYVMMNNHFLGQAPANALQIKAALSGGKVKVPTSLIEYYPILKKISE